MDKQTLSNYGWVVIAMLVIIVMIAFATPFGSYIKGGTESITHGLFSASNSSFIKAGLKFGDEPLLDGDGQVFIKAKPTDLSFKVAYNINSFKEVEINGEVIDSSNYDVEDGPMIVTLKKEYLSTLENGEHVITIVSEEGRASGKFLVSENKEENTGVSFVYKETKYVLYNSIGSYLIVENDGNLLMCSADNNVQFTIPSSCIDYSLNELTIKNTDTSYDGEYGVSNDGKYIYIKNGETKVAIGQKSGTCNHIGGDSDDIITTYGCYYDFYDKNMNVVNLRTINKVTELKEFKLYCNFCMEEIPMMVYDDSDYLYMYNAIIEPQLSNGENINACVDITGLNVGGWIAVPYDYNHANGLRSSINGIPVVMTSITSDTVIPNTVKYITCAFNYYSTYGFDIPEVMNVTFNGTKDEFLNKLSHPNSSLTAIENIEYEVNHWYNEDPITVIIQCTDGEISRSSK